MSKLLIILSLVLSFNISANNSELTQMCGHLSSLTYMTDIYEVVRMGIFVPKGDIRYLTVKDSTAVELAISVVTDNPSYEHKSRLDNIDWTRRDTTDRFFVCVRGSELRVHDGRYYMDQVQTLGMWKNGKPQ